MSKPAPKATQCLLGLLVSGLLTVASNPAFADCQTDSSKAKLLLSNLKQQALSNKPINQDQFKTELETVVGRLQQGNCASELMNLMSFIQTEQQAYPAPPAK